MAEKLICNILIGFRHSPRIIENCDLHFFFFSKDCSNEDENMQKVISAININFEIIVEKSYILTKVYSSSISWQACTNESYSSKQIKYF